MNPASYQDGVLRYQLLSEENLMIREVKTVEPALLIEAFQAVMDDPDKSDHIVTLVMHFGVNRRPIGPPDRHPRGTPSFCVSND
jgi:hypothetical protein